MADWFRGDGLKSLRDVDYSVKFRVFISHKDIQKCGVQNMAKALDDSPKDALNVLGMAVYLALFESKSVRLGPAEELVPAPNKRIEVRILDYEVSAMKHLKANAINKFLSVHGTVVRVR